MKLSNKARYAVRALFDMAFYHPSKPAQVKEIAERQAIPPRFLEQIFQDLKRARIVESKRGPQGGYRLARDASDVSLGDIVRAVEGPVILGDLEEMAPQRRSGQDTRRVTESIFKDLSVRVEACLDELSIAELCERGERLGLQRPGAQRYVYVI
ncbi:MAG: Rrf2 family transcriptional regulator [Polyangiaceae bacterium]|nr:Rrf2 family transcriptional regulator [Polyangiaceae bacterium]